VLIRVQGTYRSFEAFLQGMSESDLGFRVRKVVRVHRMLIGAPAAGASTTGTAPAAEAKAVVPPTQGVSTEVYFTLPDSNVAINTITFPASSFPKGKQDVKSWLTTRVARLKRDVQRHATATSPSVETAAAGPAEEGADAAVTITDEHIGGGRDYTFRSAAEANDWLSKRPQFEVVRLGARLALWERALALLNEDDRVSTDGDIVINVRPEEHLTKANQRYTFVADRTSGVELDFGLLTFASNVSGTVGHGSRSE
jgi:hypothetical protein